MSARGIEVHNGYIEIPGGVQGIIGGSWDSPLAKGVADEAGIQMIMSVSAESGESVAGYFGVKANNDSGNLSIKGVRARATVLTGVDTGTGRVDGVHVEVEAIGTAVVGAQVMGIRVEIYVEGDATLSSDVQGIAVLNYINVQPGGTYELLRLEEDGSAVPDNALGVYVLDCSNFLYLTPTAPSSGAWNIEGDKTGGTAAGFIKVNIQGNTRYIQLYS